MFCSMHNHGDFMNLYVILHEFKQHCSCWLHPCNCPLDQTRNELWHKSIFYVAPRASQRPSMQKLGESPWPANPLINQGVMAAFQECRLGYHSQAGFEPRISGFLTLCVNHYATRGMHKRKCWKILQYFPVFPLDHLQAVEDSKKPLHFTFFWRKHSRST